MWTTYNIKKWTNYKLCYHKLNKSANSIGGEKGNFGCWHAVWLMLKLNKSALLFEKITTKKFYVIRKFKRQGCLGEYKKETYLQDKFYFNLHPPLILESALSVKRS